MYKIEVYVPESCLKAVKAAMFEAGGGMIGNYDSCCWQVKGQGQFRPLEGSQPFIGDRGTVEVVDEYLVHLVCDDDRILDVVAAAKAAHQYEEPALQYWQVQS